ncbi:TetR/AcrR family transcriptional regulator [Bifidobacterium crudilactis]|jgi:AcrR family transcriptional regulator|uniref:TetR/AcrR family transcriptional regulator n=1 Tax=Bifidobacterium crudilactis TaxID=327277 RepID=UPI002F353137
MNRNDTKQRLVEHTAETISKLGWEQVSIRTLTHDLGLTTGSFYKHFSSKEALFDTVAKAMSRNLREEVFPAVQSQMPDHPEHALLAIGKTLLERSLHEARQIDFLFFSPWTRSALEDGNHVFPLLELTKTVIEAIVRDRDLDIAPQTLFLQVWAFLQGFVQLLHQGVIVEDDALMQRTLTTLITPTTSEERRAR